MSLKLPRFSPPDRRFPPSAVHAFLDEAQGKEWELHSFMILRQGAVEAEGWWAPYGPDHPHSLFSVSKSFTSTAIGFAQAEGRLSVDDYLVSFFPELLPDEPSPCMGQMRIRHLLTMSTGHDKESLDWIREHEPKHWVRGFLKSALTFEPGMHFVYNSGATYMLSAIIQQVSGMTLLEYLEPRLFKPLGITGATWETCPEGRSLGGSGLSVTTEDIAKLGQLYLRKGVWNGVRLLPEAWVEEATSAQISNGDDPASDWAQGYGYQFWRCQHGFYRGAGMLGQFCIVLEKYDAVIAITSGMDNMPLILAEVWRSLLPGFEGTMEPADEAEYARLDERLQSLALPLPVYQSSSPLEASFRGRRYVYEANEDHLEAVEIVFMEDGAVLTVWEEGARRQWACGRGAWRFSENSGQKVAASCTWRDDQTLLVTQCLFETPFTRTFEFRPAGDELSTSIVLNALFTQPRTIVGKAE